MICRLIVLGLSLALLPSCESKQRSQWDNIDYSRIARENQRRENDSGYTAPNVIGCVDDDLYNCNPNYGANPNR